MTKRIDAAAVRPRGRTLVAVEAKASDWMRGLSQALIYQLSAHRVYVAIAAAQHQVNLSLFRRHGIGLVLAGNEVKTLVAPSPSPFVIPMQAKELKKRILGNRSR